MKNIKIRVKRFINKLRTRLKKPAVEYKYSITVSWKNPLLVLSCIFTELLRVGFLLLRGLLWLPYILYTYVPSYLSYSIYGKYPLKYQYLVNSLYFYFTRVKILSRLQYLYFWVYNFDGNIKICKYICRSIIGMLLYTIFLSRFGFRGELKSLYRSTTNTLKNPYSTLFLNRRSDLLLIKVYYYFTRRVYMYKMKIKDSVPLKLYWGIPQSTESYLKNSDILTFLARKNVQSYIVVAVRRLIGYNKKYTFSGIALIFVITSFFLSNVLFYLLSLPLYIVGSGILSFIGSLFNICLSLIIDPWIAALVLLSLLYSLLEIFYLGWDLVYLYLVSLSPYTDMATETFQKLLSNKQYLQNINNISSFSIFCYKLHSYILTAKFFLFSIETPVLIDGILNWDWENFSSVNNPFQFMFFTGVIIVFSMLDFLLDTILYGDLYSKILVIFILFLFLLKFFFCSIFFLVFKLLYNFTEYICLFLYTALGDFLFVGLYSAIWILLLYVIVFLSSTIGQVVFKYLNCVAFNTFGSRWDLIQLSQALRWDKTFECTRSLNYYYSTMRPWVVRKGFISEQVYSHLKNSTLIAYLSGEVRSYLYFRGINKTFDYTTYVKPNYSNPGVALIRIAHTDLVTQKNVLLQERNTLRKLDRSLAQKKKQNKYLKFLKRIPKVKLAYLSVCIKKKKTFKTTEKHKIKPKIFRLYVEKLKKMTFSPEIKVKRFITRGVLSERKVFRYKKGNLSNMDAYSKPLVFYKFRGALINYTLGKILWQGSTVYNSLVGGSNKGDGLATVLDEIPGNIWTPWQAFLSYDPLRATYVGEYIKLLAWYRGYLYDCIENGVPVLPIYKIEAPKTNIELDIFIMEDLWTAPNYIQDNLRIFFSNRLPFLDRVRWKWVLKKNKSLISYTKIIKNLYEPKEVELQDSALNILADAEPITPLLNNEYYQDLYYTKAIVYETEAYGRFPMQILWQRKSEQYVTKGRWNGNPKAGLGLFTIYSKHRRAKSGYLDFHIQVEFDPLHEVEEVDSIPWYQGEQDIPEYLSLSVKHWPTRILRVAILDNFIDNVGQFTFYKKFYFRAWCLQIQPDIEDNLRVFDLNLTKIDYTLPNIIYPDWHLLYRWYSWTKSKKAQRYIPKCVAREKFYNFGQSETVLLTASNKRSYNSFKEVLIFIFSGYLTHFQENVSKSGGFGVKFPKFVSYFLYSGQKSFISNSVKFKNTIKIFLFDNYYHLYHLKGNGRLWWAGTLIESFVSLQLLFILMYWFLYGSVLVLNDSWVNVFFMMVELFWFSTIMYLILCIVYIYIYITAPNWWYYRRIATKDAIFSSLCETDECYNWCLETWVQDDVIEDEIYDDILMQWLCTRGDADFRASARSRDRWLDKNGWGWLF